MLIGCLVMESLHHSHMVYIFLRRWQASRFFCRTNIACIFCLLSFRVWVFSCLDWLVWEGITPAHVKEVHHPRTQKPCHNAQIRVQDCKRIRFVFIAEEKLLVSFKVTIFPAPNFQILGFTSSLKQKNTPLHSSKYLGLHSRLRK